MRKSDNGIPANVASLLICGLLAGVVVAAAAFPLFAATGLAAKAGGEAFGQLPVQLTVKQSPQISYVYASDNKTLLASMYDENRRDLPLAEIPERVRLAMIAAEDQKFYKHNGVDVKGIARAFIANKSSGDVQQGASTITMQFVRMSISYSAGSAEEVIKATEDTNARKLREVRYAIALEQKMSKDQILEGYLNTAYFGNRAYGIFAASQVYFGKHPKDLSLAQIALLAGMVKFPGDYNAVTGEGKQKTIERRDYVLNEMVQIEGGITQAEADAAKKEDLKITGKQTPNGCVQATTNSFGFFCDYFQRWWMQQDAFGPTIYDRERQLKSGGYRIVSTLDMQAQNGMKRAVDRHAKTSNRNPEALMLAGIEPGSGKVRALATNRNFKLDDPDKPQNGLITLPELRRKGVRGTYPNTTNPLLTPDPKLTGIQPGSVAKIFTLIAALEKGYPLSYTINAGAKYATNYKLYPPYGDNPVCGGFWCPSNDGGKAHGVTNMWTGFGKSVNTFFLPLFEQAGGARVVDVAKRLGITFYGEDAVEAATPNDWAPFVLGGASTTPLQIANVFATMAADGLYCEPTPIESITAAGGAKLDVGNPRCNQAITADVARGAIDAARCPVGDQSAFGKCNGSTARVSKGIVGNKYPLAGKTGTSDRGRSVTLTLTTKQLAISGFLSDPDWPRTNVKYSHSVVNPTVQEAMRDAMKGKPAIKFNRPSDKIAYGSLASVPTVTCMTVEAAKSAVRNAGFNAEVESRLLVDSPCPAGTAAGTNPSPKAPRGATVVIMVSNGKGAGPTKPPGPGKPPRGGVETCPPVCRPWIQNLLP